MGFLDEGVWNPAWYDTSKTGGRWIRTEAQFRNWVTADGAAGPSGTAGFKAESGRYHLYVSWACPWAHRAIIYRKLKGLEDHISMSAVNYYMAENGWTFAPQDGMIPDTIHNADFMHQVYTAASPTYTGRVTVPVLWDKQQNTIVSNESPEIIRMLNTAFNDITGDTTDFCPPELLSEIDAINDYVYPKVNNGVYRSGFATTQEAYEEAVVELFDALDTLEERLSKQRYLVGHTLTEADWRLFTTLVRFDSVYVGHFKCNIRRIYDYPNLWNYTLDLAQYPGVMETINMTHIKGHYYASHDTINPTRVIPVGPDLDLTVPHDRDRF